MKLRIHKNSIRLRLSQGEVDEISQGNPIHELVEMGGLGSQDFGYHLVPTDGSEEIYAVYANNQLDVFFPLHQATHWAQSETVSVITPSESKLAILIEKDFQCLHERPGEDESNNFPNPSA